MKIRALLSLIIAIFFISGCSTAARYRIEKNANKNIIVKVPEGKLRVGEKLTYNVEWLGVDVGIVTLSIKDIVQQNGRQAYHIVARAETTAGISKVYKIEDDISTYIDVETLLPLRFEKIQREGRYKSDEYVDFDHEKQKAFYFSRKNHSKKEYSIPKGVQDPLSCLYYFRLQDLSKKESLFTSVNIDEKSWFLETKVIKKGYVTIKGMGELEAFMVQPLPWFQGELKGKARATVWFSADEKRIPLAVITTSVPFIGTIYITLIKIEEGEEIPNNK
jgi:hypothetical protein